MSALNLSLEQTDFKPVGDIKIPDIFKRRLKCGVEKIDRLFGGGILPTSSFTLDAPPGTGKTTLLMQLLSLYQLAGYEVGYASSEEHVTQIAYNSQRTGIKTVPIANISDVDVVCDKAKDLDLLIVDSFNSLTTKQKFNSRKKEEYCINRIIQAAKVTECAIGVIVHVTKAEEMKGTTLIPHATDCNLKLRNVGDSNGDSGIRVLFCPQKNRFGALGECTLQMTSAGFDFEATPEVSDDEIAGLDQPKKILKVSTKQQRRQDELAKILGCKEITVVNVADIIGDSQRATWRLNDLVNGGFLTKEGRGEDARWVKTGKIFKPIK